MALTKSYDLPQAERVSRNVGIITGKISFDDSYPTGGESLDLTDRLKTVLAVFIENKSGYIFEYDYTNKKVKAFTPVKSMNATLNVKDNDDAGTVGVALYFDEDGTAGQRLQFVSPTNNDGSDTCVSISASPGAEVADATDLSSLTNVRFVAYGLI